MEHFYKLFPISILPETTHTLLEVIHSSNREHRHRLKSDSKQGYYLYLWAIAFPDNAEISNDFDELHSYSAERSFSSFLLEGKKFNPKDFSLAIEKGLLPIKEIMERCSVQVLFMEVK